ncbi:MAG: CotH kinase family protein [Verrucomicrobia bacterium]|nr:CotH kinase family protein [Verrucomicrobiota bacterium]
MWIEAGGPSAVLNFQFLAGRAKPRRWLCFLLLASQALATVDEGRNAPAPASSFFTSPAVHPIAIEIPRRGVTALRREPRKYVPASVRVGGARYDNVAVHLKGATGSFRGIDDKPSLTLDFGRFAPGQSLHGLSKIHLNNSVEDRSFLNERIGTELFLAAGVPAPQATWAMVELNGRRLGLYVLKEGFTAEFLSGHFTSGTGNLYEGSGADVTDSLPRDSGPGPNDGADLKRLASAVTEPDLAKRWARLQEALDLDRFVSFMAAEVMICHRDGYCLARNNYRIYHDPASDRLVFLPHGMDQLFGRADTPIEPHTAGLVATALLETEPGRQRYRERLQFLHTNVFNVADLTAKMDRWAAQIQPVLNRSEARVFRREVSGLKERIANRHRHLAQQLAAPEPKPLRFDGGVATLTNWFAVDEPAGGKLERAAAPDGTPSLAIRAGPSTTASWRSVVRLAPGRYRFEARVRTADVKPLAFGKNRGAGVRVSGTPPPRPYDLVGDRDWTDLEFEFEVASEKDVEVIAELRAAKGQAWFRLDALRLVQLK